MLGVPRQGGGGEGFPVIQTEDLTKVYGMGEVEVTALDQVDLRIDRGEFVAVMGPSGSGMSTLMNILGCLDRPTAGGYCLDGEDVSQMDRAQLAAIRNRRIGFIFQSYNLLARTTALQNVILPLYYYHNGGMLAAARAERGRAMLAMVGLEDRLDHQPHQLSGGQQQRVAIARALINEPVLILADDPTGNLDSHSGDEIMGLLHRLHADGRTIVMVTHNPVIASHTDRTITLQDGRIDTDVRNGARQRPALVEVAT
ncbi:MAG: putative ABC transporter ATP-binding protein [Anaerolineales bacterium]|nr:putative ABC transporter ATP-binding protein [Anaerolineales bacterium]